MWCLEQKRNKAKEDTGYRIGEGKKRKPQLGARDSRDGEGKEQ